MNYTTLEVKEYEDFPEELNNDPVLRVLFFWKKKGRHGFSPMMFAALSGRRDIGKLSTELLEHPMLYCMYCQETGLPIFYLPSISIGRSLNSPALAVVYNIVGLSHSASAAVRGSLEKLLEAVEEPIQYMTEAEIADFSFRRYRDGISSKEYAQLKTVWDGDVTTLSGMCRSLTLQWALKEGLMNFSLTRKVEQELRELREKYPVLA